MSDAREEARRRLLRELSTPVDVPTASGGPDLTADVMARLGYMRGAPAAAARHRRRQQRRRIGSGVGLILMAAVAVWWHAGTEHARTRAAVTLPEAVAHDVEVQRARMRRSIDTVRLLLPAAPAFTPVTEPTALPEEADRSGMGPIDDPAWRVSPST